MHLAKLPLLGTNPIPWLFLAYRVWLATDELCCRWRCSCTGLKCFVPSFGDANMWTHVFPQQRSGDSMPTTTPYYFLE